MEHVKEELAQLWDKISALEKAIKNSDKYKGNKYYKEKYNQAIKELNRSYKFFSAKLQKIEKPSLNDKLETLNTDISYILDEETTYSEKLTQIHYLEQFWPELEIEFEDLKVHSESFEIPKEIPANESRLDLEESIKDYDNECYPSALVMCRRAYEGALVEAYKSIEKREPVDEVRCNSCKNVIRNKSYIGISKLHSWAMERGLVTEKLRQLGFLVSDIGAGGAHPPLMHFPRDKEIARLGITATITLLKQLYSKTK
jgi:hypothetical protein